MAFVVLTSQQVGDLSRCFGTDLASGRGRSVTAILDAIKSVDLALCDSGFFLQSSSIRRPLWTHFQTLATIFGQVLTLRPPWNTKMHSGSGMNRRSRH